MQECWIRVSWINPSKKINCSVNGFDFRAPFLNWYFHIFTVSHSNDLPFFWILWSRFGYLFARFFLCQNVFLIVHGLIELCTNLEENTRNEFWEIFFQNVAYFTWFVRILFDLYQFLRSVLGIELFEVVLMQ